MSAARSEGKAPRVPELRRRLVMITVVALLAIPQLAAAADQPPPPPKSNSATGKGASGQFPKLWHSVSTQHDFRVEVKDNVFRAEWVNVPPATAKQGVYIRTECRRSGSKWVGASSLNMLFAVRGAPAGKDTKVCHLNVRFEVDSLSPEKITGHSEKLKDFDVNTCQVRQTNWGEFTWVPKR